MSRVNYRLLPQAQRQQRARPKPRTPSGTAPKDTVGSVGPAAGLADAMMTAQTQAAMIQQPKAGGAKNPVSPTNQILQPGAEKGGAIGTALRGSTGFKSRRK